MTGFFSKLKAALSKTSSKIGSGIEHLFIKKKLDDSNDHYYWIVLKSEIEDFVFE